MGPFDADFLIFSILVDGCNGACQHVPQAAGCSIMPPACCFDPHELLRGHEGNSRWSPQKAGGLCQLPVLRGVEHWGSVRFVELRLVPQVEKYEATSPPLEGPGEN